MLLLTDQFHDSFECFSVIGYKNTIGDQYLSHCFRDLLIRRDLPANSTVRRTYLARAGELSSRTVSVKMGSKKPKEFYNWQKFPYNPIHSLCTQQFHTVLHK